MPNGDMILAVDPAKHTGIAEGRPGSAAPMLRTIDFGRELDEPHDVWARALRWIEGRFESSPPCILAIEQPIPMSEAVSNNAIMSIGLHAVFTGYARKCDVPVMIIPIQSWRKYALGRGNLKGRDAKLQAVRLCAQLKWSTLELDHNAAEAACIWLYACAQIAPEKVRRHEPLFLAGSPQ